MPARPFIPFICNAEVAEIGRGVLDLSLPIRAYNEATGVANTYTEGYHETITQASLRAARSFLLQERGRSLFET